MKVSIVTTAAAGLLTSLVAGPAASAAIAEFTADFDRWNYPFNADDGVRETASTFSTDDDRFDDRDGQFLVGFNTAAALPALAPGQRYQINAVTVTATHSIGTFVYDPTYDAYTTHLPSDDPDFTADSDAGRPIILTGAALRSGFTSFGFGSTDVGAPIYEEGEHFSPDEGKFPPVLPTQRYAYAAAFDSDGNLVDISNNIVDRFDVTPFAVGTTDLDPGDSIVEATATTPGSVFSFALDLSDANVLGYVQQGVSDGGLFFSITSLHLPPGEQEGGTIPDFFTRDAVGPTFPAGVAPTISIDYSIVPEPATLAVALLGGCLAMGRRVGRRTR